MFFSEDDERAYEAELVVWERLEEQRREAIEAIGLIVRQDEAENFAMILAAANMVDSPQAEIISKKLDLSPSDFLAIERNFKDYRTHLIQKGWNL